MSNKAAQRYAKAVLELASEQNKTEEVNTEMKRVSTLLSENKDLLEAIKNPTVNAADKRSLLRAIFEDFGAISKGLFDILLDNKRIDILEKIALKYVSRYNELNHIQEARVTTAVPLTDEIEEKILSKVKELTGDEATLENEIDENILGGFILRIGDLQYNASVAGNLNRLKKEFKKTSFQN